MAMDSYMYKNIMYRMAYIHTQSSCNNAHWCNMHSYSNGVNNPCNACLHWWQICGKQLGGTYVYVYRRCICLLLAIDLYEYLYIAKAKPILCTQCIQSIEILMSKLLQLYNKIQLEEGVRCDWQVRVTWPSRVCLKPSHRFGFNGG